MRAGGVVLQQLAKLLDGRPGYFVMDPGHFRHDYTGTSISLVSLPCSNSSRAARYS